MKLKKQIILLLFSVIWLVSMSKKNLIVFAEETESLNFTYENIMPKNQISSKSYFDLLITPGVEQTVITRVTNQTDKELIVGITASNATTSYAGTINYGPSSNKKSKSESIRFTDIIEVPNRVILKAKETKEVEIKINPPKTEFDGIILGGIQLKEIEENMEEKKNEGAVLNSEYSYIYSMSLRENDKKIETNLVSSSPFYDGIVYSVIDNLQPVIVEKMTVDTQLMPLDSDKVIKENRVEGVRAAPSSVINIGLPGTEDLEPGSYRVKNIVYIEDKSFEFEEKFEIAEKDKNDVKNLIDESVIEKKINWWFLFLGILIFVGLVISVFIVLKRFF